jgi:hypothetical protein
VLDLSLRGSGPVRREAVGVVLGCKDNVLYVERYGWWSSHTRNATSMVLWHY